MEYIVRGFNYENYLRNEELFRSGFKPQQPYKSGTTVVGFRFDNGVMIAADTRATQNNMITSSGSRKIHRLQDNIYCGGSGYASDLENNVAFVSAQLDMHSKITNYRQVPVVCGKQLIKEALIKQRGRVINSFIIGGVDKDGVHLCVVHHDGTSMMTLFATIGSGQFGAMGILENRWQPDMDEDDARELIVDAVTAGINNDLFSGSGVELCIIRTDNSIELCSEPVHNTLRYTRLQLQNVQQGATEVSTTCVHDIIVTKEIVDKLTVPISIMKIQAGPLPPIRRNKLQVTEARTSLLGKRKFIEDTVECSPSKKRRFS